MNHPAEKKTEARSDFDRGGSPSWGKAIDLANRVLRLFGARSKVEPTTYGSAADINWGNVIRCRVVYISSRNGRWIMSETRFVPIGEPLPPPIIELDCD